MRDRTKLIIGTIIWWGAAVPGGGMAIMTPMMFDAPGSLENPSIIAAALAVISFPVVAALSPVLAWIAYALSWPRGARTILLAPVLSLLAVLITFSRLL